MGKGLSKQLHSICNGIKEIDELLGKMPCYKNKLIESHPEICFTMLNSSGIVFEPIYEKKKTEEGIQKRLSLLRRYYDKVDEITTLIYKDLKLSKIKDDVIDDRCLAVTGM